MTDTRKPAIPVSLDQGQVAMAIAKAIGSSTVSLSRSQVAWALWHLVVEENGSHFDDDAGCDWYTDDDGNTFIGGEWGWHVSSKPNVAALIDAINIIHHGRPFKMEGQRPEVEEEPND
jgi:hypothetical protein